MAFCPNCGTQSDGRFCPQCGNRVTQSPDPSSFSGAGTAPQAGGLSENVACALCYVLTAVTGILFLVLEPYNRNRRIRFHAFQSIFFSVAIVVAWILVGMVSSILAHIPILGWIVGLLLICGLTIVLFLLWLFLMWKAYNNELYLLPIIGPFAEKQA